ncbi:MAG: AraC family transcriptional regulator [Acidobacteriota bacterium]
MRYEEFLPAAALRRWIQCYWFLHADHSEIAPEPVLPDGSFELVFQLGDPFSTVVDGKERRQSPAVLVSEMRGPVVVSPSGRAHSVGIRFRPGGAYPFFRQPLHEIVDAVHPLDDLWGSRAMGVRSGLGELFSNRDRARYLDRELLPLLHGTDDGFDRIMEVLRRRRGQVRVDSLARLSGISSRQLERRFVNATGASPKFFLRLLRFRFVVQAMQSSPQDWLDAAMAQGFYDQPHLVNEFRSFSGMTPGRFLANEFPLNVAFFQDSSSEGV